MIFEELNERISAVQELLSTDTVQSRISQVAALRVQAEYKNRVFVEGRTSDGSPIGQYSTKPFYQNPNALIGVSSSGVKPKGKNGRSRFKSGKPKKTRYLPQGYKELRELTGRQSETVDLNFSGSLERSVRVVQLENQAFVRFTVASEIEKIEANERRFGVDIITASDEEREAGIEAARAELQFILESLDQ